MSIGPGAALWLTEAGAAGASRVRAKMADAVALAKLAGPDAVDQALAQAAVAGRFTEGDLASVLAYRRNAASGEACSASDAHSLQAGTAPWGGFGK